MECGDLQPDRRDERLGQYPFPPGTNLSQASKSLEKRGHWVRYPKIATVCLEMKTGAPEASQSTER